MGFFLNARIAILSASAESMKSALFPGLRNMCLNSLEIVGHLEIAAEVSLSGWLVIGKGPANSGNGGPKS